jgi:type IV secretory pathway VirB6-like protein
MFGSYCKTDCQYCLSEGPIISQTFKLIVTDNIFVSGVRALLVLYIAWIGLAFMTGLAPFTQREGLMVIIKSSLIIAMIGPNSWDFFYQYLFAALIEGQQYLLQFLTYEWYALTSSTRSCIEWLSIVTAFDHLIDEISSGINWIRIFSMLFSGSFVGIIAMTFLIMGVAGAFFSIIKALISIVVAFISLTIFIVLFPLFITFILFKQTQEMARKWFKQVLIFALDPVVVCGALSVFIGVTIILLKMILGFTICSVCLFTVDLVVLKLCVPIKFVPVFTLHSPDSFYVPMLVMGGAFAFALMAHGLYVIPQIASDFLKQMIDVSAIATTGVAGITEIGATVTTSVSRTLSTISTVTGAVPNTIMTLLGRDEKSRQKREDEAQKEINEE